MSDEPEDTCTARTLRAGYEVTCDREPDHPSVHLGKSLADDGGTELHQWPDAQSIGDDDGPVDELPLWYGVLPLGRKVKITLRGVDFGVLDDAELLGVVLDDHEQPAALVARSAGRRVLYPWHQIGALSWDDEQ